MRAIAAADAPAAISPALRLIAQLAEVFPDQILAIPVVPSIDSEEE